MSGGCSDLRPGPVRPGSRPRSPLDVASLTSYGSGMETSRRTAVSLLLVLPLACGGANGSDALPTGDAVVRVMTFNIRYGTANDGDDAWPLRRQLVFDVIREFEPGVLGLQEALRFQLDELGAALPGYREIGVGRDDGVRAGEYAAILVDTTRFTVSAEGTFWLSDRPAEPGSMTWGNRIPRICTWVSLRDRGGGRAFHVFNVHWDHESQASRERSARLLMDRIAARREPGTPVIVTGDFNAGESNPAFRALVTDVAVSLRDAFRALHADAGGVGTFNGFRGDRDGEKIDAILVSPEWMVNDAAIVRTHRGGRYPSDHFPVAAVLQIPDRGRAAGR